MVFEAGSLRIPPIPHPAYSATPATQLDHLFLVVHRSRPAYPLKEKAKRDCDDQVCGVAGALFDIHWVSHSREYDCAVASGVFERSLKFFVLAHEEVPVFDIKIGDHLCEFSEVGGKSC